MALYKIEKDASGVPTGETSLVAGGTLYSANPVGTILPFGGTDIPTGWGLCDGSAVSRTTYAELFAVIGTSFGVGDGSTTFNLPDMRESVPKGAGLTGHTVGAHLDADGLAVGEFLDDRVQSHTHSLSYNVVAYAYTPSGGEGYGTTPSQKINATNANNGRSGATTEVKSVGVNYIICMKEIAVPADFLAKVDEAVEDVYGDIIPSDASASNKLMTRSCIRYSNASDLEDAIVNLSVYSQLDFVAMSTITIGGVTLPQYTAWHIYRDSNGRACIGGVGYSYLDGSCYKINGSIDFPEGAGLALTMQKLVTQNDLNKAITVTTPDNNIVIADSRLITDNLVMVSGYIKSGTQLAFNTSQVNIGKLSVSGRTVRGSGPCSLFLFSNDLFGINGPNTISAIWKAAQGWLSIGRDVTNSPKLSEDAWFTAMLPLLPLQ